MVKIRLARRGRKKLALYDLVVANVTAPRDGRFIEKIGTYNPNTIPASIVLNDEKALSWLLNGAQPTDTVKAILSYRGVLYRKHLQIGVIKGAITQADADSKFEEWKTTKDSKITGRVDNLAQAKVDAAKARLEAEVKVNTNRVAVQAAKLAAEIAAANPAPAVVEAPVAEAPAVEKTPIVEAPVAEEVVAVAEPAAVVADAPVEVAPVVEKVKAPVAEAVAETPVEVAPVVEEVVEAPVAEAVTETPVEVAPVVEEVDAAPVAEIVAEEKTKSSE